MSVWVAGAGSGERFRKVPGFSGYWCRFRGRFRRDLEGSGEFRHVLVKVPEAGSGGFRRRAGVGSGGRIRKVLENSGAAILTGTAI